MTHEDARLLLAAYALGAADADVDALEEHIHSCDRCKAELAGYLDTAAMLGEAVKTVPPPAALRTAVLGRIPPQRNPFQRLTDLFVPSRRSSVAVAVAMLVAVVALAAAVIQQQQIQLMRSELALNSQGLALLTSTEVIAERLAPVLDPTSQAHGHWYHRPGVATQVVVVEFLPPPPPGVSYYAWLHHENGSWTSPGTFSLDGTGYGRLIILGSDGTDVTAVVVTRQTEPSQAPSGDTVLRWPPD